jgi:hypothetical protein
VQVNGNVFKVIQSNSLKLKEVYIFINKFFHCLMIYCCHSTAIMDGVLSEVPEGPEEVLPVAAANAEEQVSVEPAEEKSVDNFSNGENSEDAPAEVENASDQLDPTIKSEIDAPITLNGMDSNTSFSNFSGAFSLLSAYEV